MMRATGAAIAFAMLCTDPSWGHDGERGAGGLRPTSRPAQSSGSGAPVVVPPSPPGASELRSADRSGQAPKRAGQHQHSHRHQHEHVHVHGSGQRHHHQPPEQEESYEITVYGRRESTAASSRVIRDRDLALRPMRRPADILQVTPGLFVVQHAGGGKANQYFLRGFDVDHGTDLAIFVDGVPVNMVSHGHGQGYADLNWLIPETVRRIEVNKGPYFARYGDFATAGALNLVTHQHFKVNSVKLAGGMFNTLRGVGALSHRGDDWQPLLAGEYYRTDGPFDNRERLQRFNLFGKVGRLFAGGHRLFLAATAYGSDWRASGQIPLREVRAGRLDRFDSVDRNEGGNSQRLSIYGGYRGPIADGIATLSAYMVRSTFNLFSNFTFFSRDPELGDMIEQGDNRTVLGINGEYRLQKVWRRILFDTTFGLQARSDAIETSLYQAPARERTRAVVNANVFQSNLSFFVREAVIWRPWLRSIIGLRGDYFGFDVEDQLEDLGTRGSRTSGVRRAVRLSPKASLVLSSRAGSQLYLNFGTGFHSNDARGVVRGTQSATPITAAVGYEIGVRRRLWSRLDLAASFFGLHLDSESVWIGDEGTTEQRGSTRRLGIEGEARLQILKWLFADLDVTGVWPVFVDASDGDDDIPLAPRLLITAGLSARHPAGFFGRAGAVYLGDRPATEDGFLSAEGFFRLDLTLGYRHRRFAVALSLQNATNSSWREAQFATTSRLRRESNSASCPAGTRAITEGGAFVGCEDISFTPGWPISLQASASLYF